jgi:F0F1-type ATP synthase assembly protein I
MPKEMESKEKSVWQGLALAGELGYTIAIPLIVFALLGRFLDKKIGTSPWFLLAGILLALATSAIGVGKKIMEIIKEQKKEEEKKKQ